MNSLRKIIKYGLLALQREGKGPGNSRNDKFSSSLRGYFKTITDKQVLNRVNGYIGYSILTNRVLSFPSDLPKDSVSEFIANKTPFADLCMHPVDDYVEAFRSFHHEPKGYLGAGGE